MNCKNAMLLSASIDIKGKETYSHNIFKINRQENKYAIDQESYKKTLSYNTVLQKMFFEIHN